MKIAWFAAFAAMSAMAASAGQSPAQRDARELARFERFASPPQPSFHYFKLDNFQYLGKNANNQDAIAVWTGVNQVYLLTLQSPCIGLDFAFAIGLGSSSGDINAGMDFIKYRSNGPQQCKIETIQKVDYKALRAEKAGG